MSLHHSSSVPVVCGVSVHILGSEVLLWWVEAQATLKSHVMCSCSVVHWGCGQQLRYDWGFHTFFLFDLTFCCYKSFKRVKSGKKFFHHHQWKEWDDQHSNTFWFFILFFSFTSLIVDSQDLKQNNSAILWHMSFCTVAWWRYDQFLFRTSFIFRPPSCNTAVKTLLFYRFPAA